MLVKKFLGKRLGMVGAFMAGAVMVGVAGLAITSAMAAGPTNTASATPPSNTSLHPSLIIGLRGRVATALVRTSASDNGQTVRVVLKDLLNGETLAQIDGNKAGAVESAVETKLDAQISKNLGAGKITQAQATKRMEAVKVWIPKLMHLNLSSYVHLRLGAKVG